MVICSSERLDSTFSALAHPIRRSILQRLSQGEHTVIELAEPFEVSLPAISRHLKVLEHAGLVKRSISGRNHQLSLGVEAIKSAADWIAYYQTFWTQNLDRLDSYLQQSDQEVDQSDPAPESDRADQACDEKQ